MILSIIMLLGLAMAFNGRLVAAASVAPQLRVFGLHVGSPAAQAGLDEAVQLWNDVKSNSSSTGSTGPWPSPAPPPPPNPIDRFIGDSETLLVVDLGALGGFTFLFLMSTGLTLWSRERFGQ